MQEDVARQTVQLAIRSGKVSGQLLWKALKAYIAHHNKKKAAKEVAKNTPIKGKQSVKQLVGQGQGVSSMDIGDSGVRDFKRIANKYGVDFAITKDKSIDPPKYTVFFKAKDADAITAVLKEYAAKVMEMRGLAKFIDYTSVMIENYKKAATTKVAEVKNEIVELIDRVVKRHNFLKLPLVSGVFLAKVSNRDMLQDPNNMLSFLEKNDIKSFDELHSFSSGHLSEYNKLAAKFSGYGNQIKTLMTKIEAYERFKPFLDVFRKGESLKGLTKWKYDRENREMLEAYPEQLKAFRKVVPKGEKIDPKKWNDEMAALFDKREDMEGLLQKEVWDLACVEVIDFNKKNEERERSNEVHDKARSKDRERTPSRKSHQVER